MKVVSLKENYILNLIRVFYGFLIGMASTPYILKTLGPENVGKVDYINSYISYIQVIACLGLPLYGVREIAKVKTNEEQRSKLIFEFFIILIVTTFISYILMFATSLYIQNLIVNYKLLFILAPLLFLNNFSIDWFYQGIENQRIIFFRTILIRTIGFGALFFIVKTKDDYLKYAIILMCTAIVNTCINIYYLKNYINFNYFKIKELQFKRHYKPLLVFLLAAFSNSLYMDLTNFFLGTISGNKFVGYFSISNRLVRMAITVTSVFATVLLPRFSDLYHKDLSQYNMLLIKAFKYILLLTLPFFIIIFASSSELILIFSNKDYLPAKLSLEIMSFIIIFVGLAYFLSYLIIYPMGKEKVYTYSVLYSSLISVSLGYFLIQNFQHVGASIVVLLAEILGPLFMIGFMYKKLAELKLNFGGIVNYLIAALLMYLTIKGIRLAHLNLNLYFYFLVSVIAGFSIFFLYLILLKDQIIVELKSMILQQIKIYKK